jgi:hypothetical protein
MSDQQNTEGDEDLRATYCSAKHRIATLEKQLEELHSTKRKSYSTICYISSQHLADASVLLVIGTPYRMSPKAVSSLD